MGFVIRTYSPILTNIPQSSFLQVAITFISPQKSESPRYYSFGVGEPLDGVGVIVGLDLGRQGREV